MAKLSLSEVSKQFNVDRSTIYRAVRNGRLSRSSDGQFDIAEVIRCFGEPEQYLNRLNHRNKVVMQLHKNSSLI
jgi:DNA-directed RNA polymerase specialized sigma54-like protein